MKTIKLPLFFLASALLLSGCTLSFDVTPVSFEYSSKLELSQDRAQSLAENFLITLDQQGAQSVSAFIHPVAKGDVSWIEDIVQNTRFSDPQDITVTEVQHSILTEGVDEEYNASKIVGTFQCPGSEHISDFWIQTVYYSPENIWVILGLSLEEC